MISVQSFCLSKELGGDLQGTIRQLHQIGYDGFEPFLVFDLKQGRKPEHLFAYDRLMETKIILDEYGMAMPTAHVGIGYGNFFMPTRKVVRSIRKIHDEFGIRFFAVSGLFADARGTRKWAKVCKTIAEELKTFDCTLVYHNHDVEFTTIHVGDRYMAAMDYFMELAGPNVMLQPDVGWVSNCCDEIEFVKKYADRIISIHLKDMAHGSNAYTCRNTPSELFVPVGEGNVKIKEILNLIDSLPNLQGRLVVDQDRSAGDILEDMKRSYDNIHTMLSGG